LPLIEQDCQERRLGQTRDIIRGQLGIMLEMAKPPIADLSRGFTVRPREPPDWHLSMQTGGTSRIEIFIDY